MTSSPKPRVPADHARHDRLIVTRFAGDDAYPAEVEEARALVGSCTECARLADDIRLLMAATSELPAAARPRDFRITPQQAETLRGSFLERLLRPLAVPRLAILRPVAGVAMSLGIALAVAGVALPTASPASAPANDRMMLESTGGEGSGPVPDAAAPEGQPAPAAGGRGDAEDQGAIEDPIDEAYTTDQLDATARAEQVNRPADQTRSLILYAGLALAAFSLAILIVVTFARRRAYDRLLR